jgi:hypothetical protein
VGDVARPTRNQVLVLALAIALLARLARTGRQTVDAGCVREERSAPERLARDDRAATILLGEYAFVSGLIPFYRRVEIVALGGTGATIAAVLAFVGALEAAETPNRSFEASLLSLAAVVPAVLLLLELMALTRIWRASAYIRTDLYPLARDLTAREKVLRWEFAPTASLVENLEPAGDAVGPSPRFAKLLASSAPVIVSIVLAAVAMPLAALALESSDALAPERFVGYVAALLALAVGVYASVFTLRFEARPRIAGDKSSA